MEIWKRKKMKSSKKKTLRINVEIFNKLNITVFSFCRKLPPATDNYTTIRVEMSTTEITEDNCPYLKTEATTKKLLNNIIITFHVKTILYHYTYEVNPYDRRKYQITGKYKSKYCTGTQTIDFGATLFWLVYSLILYSLNYCGAFTQI